ncbi:MAG: hypothetical protein MZV63_37790 [Marinilabiliales bacterium]|nr:hypothetical protein [Marinilabiliales bacterium]
MVKVLLFENLNFGLFILITFSHDRNIYVRLLVAGFACHSFSGSGLLVTGGWISSSVFSLSGNPPLPLPGGNPGGSVFGQRSFRNPPPTPPGRELGGLVFGLQYMATSNQQQVKQFRLEIYKFLF